MNKYIIPNWPAPSTVRAVATTRLGGFSQAPYDSFNLGYNVDDDPLCVDKNIALLCQELTLPKPPVWLKQVHGNQVISAEHAQGQEADACYTAQANLVCAVKTADCLPVLLYSQDAHEVAAIHCGWRSLAANIITHTIKALQANGEQCIAWLGPAISAEVYEVDEPLKSQFTKAYHPAFTPHRPGHYLADLHQIATIQLTQNHVSGIYRTNACTYTDSQRFFSHRRDGAKTGRMATLIWLVA